ncbi:beta-N-acetylhexosaminidase [Microlunatus soli]|uniref:beta-N-acetylhexosaminidase n=1 Tax=Microlunatus soli TaxID=630515 RepID=A0A1H1W9P2_9ACTN|nr:beta-N-acetylhexosaminidase [Microlunatus soli]SDS93370.1 hexosaminidase [Microlunatus soli]
MSAATPLNLLPQPRSVTVADGSFTLTSVAAIAGPVDWAAIVRRLIGPGTGCDLLPGEHGDLKLIKDDGLPPEGYRLTVNGDGIAITAADDRGVNWAAQTLKQLLPVPCFGPAPALRNGSRGGTAVPYVEIEDEPRFAWRGVMLDTGRHFTPYHELIGLVDLLAMHKYNTFHLHLTEDQGWRFESKKYPQLTEISSWRTETKNPHWAAGDGTPHGGFYSQDQLRALVSYAEQRGITVVPEIEFPGHVLAVLEAMPELGNHPGTGYRAATTWGVFPEVLNMSDQALAFAFDIWEEVLDIFPSRYVHVGGDECPRSEWEESSAARQLAAERGLPGPDHLQRWFTEQLRDWLAERDRQLVGWDEINDEGILAGAVTMAWRDEKYGVAAAQGGLPVVVAPVSKTYFDYYPSDDPDEYYSIGGLIDTERAYSLEPTEGIPAELHDQILGTQCQVWTEYMPTMRRVQYMLFPRACAHSEVAWSDPDGRSWQEFSDRLAGHLTRLDLLGVDYRPESGARPWQRGGTGLRQRPAAHRKGATA